VFDIRRLPDLLYIVMEFVEGETLLERIERKGALQPRDALRVGIQVAKALEAAEKQGIVHRDLKPANIMISGLDGAAKIVDFGLAKDMWALTGGLTGPEETLGTIRYMPPEQVRNAAQADHRADIYALAATLYHAFSGKPPYHDRKELDLMRCVVSGQLPQFDPKAEQITPQVYAVLAKALRPDPNERFKTALEMRQALGGAVAAIAGIPGFKGDPELLLEIRDPRALDTTWSGRMPSVPKPGGMAGAFEGEQLVEFVQMLGMTSKTGVLQINGDILSGHMAFREGKVINAVTSKGTRGREACYEILGAKSGGFEFRPDLPQTVKTEVMLQVEGLLLEALRRRDESGGGAKADE
jgi:serine/threonine protein kinase